MLPLFDRRACAACRAPTPGDEFVCVDCWSTNYCSAARCAAHRAGKHARECETLGAAMLASVREQAERGWRDKLNLWGERAWGDARSTHHRAGVENNRDHFGPSQPRSADHILIHQVLDLSQLSGA